MSAVSERADRKTARVALHRAGAAYLDALQRLGAEDSRTVDAANVYHAAGAELERVLRTQGEVTR